MAYDERRRGRRQERDERGPEWRGDEGFGGGWGNQVPRPQRLGDRAYRGMSDDPDYGPRYGAGGAHGYGGGWYGPNAADSDYRYGGPGLDSEFAGPRFDRADVGSVGSEAVHPVSSASSPGYGTGAGMFGSSARDFAIRQEAQRHDPHYAEWRHRQMAEFDRDYDEYRRENQSTLRPRVRRVARSAGASSAQALGRVKRAYGGGRVRRRPCRQASIARAATASS